MMRMTLNEIIKKILEADEAYYSGGHPVMTDQEYDTLKKFVKEKDSDHPILAKIGDKPSPAWEKATHKMNMGSLNNIFNEEEFRKWVTKFPQDTLFTAQPKLDGLSIELIYKNSQLTQAITRGDGTKGEDITANVLKMKNTLKRLENSFDGYIRAEILLPRENFEKINSILKTRYENARNAASGISRRLDGKFCQYLVIIPYDMIFSIPEEYGVDGEDDENMKIETLKHMGFKTPFQIIGTTETMIKTYNQVNKKRPDYSVGIDGVVVKVCSHKIQKEAGRVNNRPKAQVAWKFEAPGEITTFIEETWDVGRTGVITPLAHISPVKIEGSTISKVTLHNVAEIKRLGIGRGDTVMVVKAGDIIPKITHIIKHENNPIEIPTRCPSCDSELKNDNIRLFCMNDFCPKKNLNRIINFIRVTKIENFGESLVNILFDSGKLQHIADLYLLNEEDISDIEGWGKKSAASIIESINKTKLLDSATFLSAIGIPSISDKTAQELIKSIGGIEQLRKASVDHIKALRGFSDISANKIVNYLVEYSPQIDELLKHIKLEDTEKTGKFTGLSFCFTGNMEKPRSYYQKIIKEFGGINKNSVTKNLSYLVYNEDKGSTKSQKAKQYGIKIINEEEFTRLSGGENKIKEKAKKEDPEIENFSLW